MKNIPVMFSVCSCLNVKRGRIVVTTIKPHTAQVFIGL